MVNSASYRVLTSTPYGTSYRGFSSRPSPFSDVTHTAFCRKVYHADRLCPRLFTLRTLKNSDRISTIGATSCSMHRTARFHIPDPFRAIIPTPLRHTARTAAQPQIARTPHVHVCMNGGERGGTKGRRGSRSPATRARPFWPTHTPPRVSLARLHTAFCPNPRYRWRHHRP